MFVDKRNFTKDTQSLSLENLLIQLNEHIEKVSIIIKPYGGKIDKFLGDGILILFDSSKFAVEAAIKLVQQIPNIGVGIDCGEVLYGTIGNPNSERLDWSVIGVPVNRAFRIEGLTSKLKTPILYTETVSHNYPSSYLGLYELKGFSLTKLFYPQ
jgi:adenylate cyclase